MTAKWGSALTSGERVSICKACGGGFIPPSHGDCCSERCVYYLALASVPVLGDPLFCRRDEPIKCWSCELVFMSRGLVVCPECFCRARSGSTEAEGETALAPDRRAFEPIIDRKPPRTLCHW
jgi:hypothetical protein